MNVCILNNSPDIPDDPEELLAGVFQECIDVAIDESRARGMDPDQIGCTIQSALLNSEEEHFINKIKKNIFP